jgi:hypothetical protein
MSILGTAAVVEDLSILGTADVVSDLNTLATSAVVSDLETVADNITGVTSFADRYRVASSAPVSSLDEGDLYFNTTDNTLYHYNGSAWVAVQSYTAGTGITLSSGEFSASPIALTTIQTAASEVAQLALTAQEGDVVVRSDEAKTYMHNGGSAGTIADFTLMATPTDSVTSVVGNTGAVTDTQILTALEDGIDSVHYKDGSIDNVHLADDAVDSDELAASAVDIAHLSATGTSDSSTFLRGDNTWVTPTDTDTVYTHPTTDGNKHIPSGGSSGQFLKYSSAGTATWASDNDTVYTHPTSDGNVHIPSGGATGQILKYSSAGTAAWGSDDAVAMAIALG